MSVDRDGLVALAGQVLPDLPADATVFLVGDTSHVWEGWIPRAPEATLAVGAADGDRRRVEGALSAAAGLAGLPLRLESPGDVVPLPPGVEARHRPAGGAVPAIRHFDPYGVALRVLARGDEPDYHTVLRLLRRGWVVFDELARLLDTVLPRFTSAAIAQDPAEFRRKFRGLTQMWRAEQGHAARLFGAPVTASERAPVR